MNTIVILWNNGATTTIEHKTQQECYDHINNMNYRSFKQVFIIGPNIKRKVYDNEWTLISNIAARRMPE